jgi:TPP-dependent pyruvate/acetoin dehydrogenase alpha subunit
MAIFGGAIMSSDLDLYRQMARIRCFEETVLAEFKRGVFAGTTHTSLGQEANAVGVISCLDQKDIVFSNHRCHGHFLAYGGDMRALFAEMMGKATGVSGGRGGSQHLHWRNIFSSGIQAGSTPFAVGAALAEVRKGTGAVITAFIGDGTLGQGILYESLNLSSLWHAPVLWVLEDNAIAQTTPTVLAMAGRIDLRFTAFDIPVTELDTSDVLEIRQTAETLTAEMRFDNHPRALILHTARFGPHSKGDDTRPEAVVAELRRTRDPLAIQRQRLSASDADQVDREVAQETAAAFEQALADPYPTMDEVQP